MPELLPNDIERLIILDTGDIIVLRDLSEMYNWNMENKMYSGVLDMGINRFGLISQKIMEIYINTGDYLIDVKKVKKAKMYEKYVKYKNVYKSSIIAEQDLINDVAYGQIGYLPMKYGIIGPFINDRLSDNYHTKGIFKYYKRAKHKELYPFLPKNMNEMYFQAYNPVVIHQFFGKWVEGSGLTIYRRLAQYYIKLAGIWDEMCEKHPGYCKK